MSNKRDVTPPEFPSTSTITFPCLHIFENLLKKIYSLFLPFCSLSNLNNVESDAKLPPIKYRENAMDASASTPGDVLKALVTHSQQDHCTPSASTLNSSAFSQERRERVLQWLRIRGNSVQTPDGIFFLHEGSKNQKISKEHTNKNDGEYSKLYSKQMCSKTNALGTKEKNGNSNKLKRRMHPEDAHASSSKTSKNHSKGNAMQYNTTMLH